MYYITPHDGLPETQDVDAYLKEKLKYLDAMAVFL
jgi:hypothetical protein